MLGLLATTALVCPAGQNGDNFRYSTQLKFIERRWPDADTVRKNK